MTGNSKQLPKIRHHTVSLKGINPRVTPEGFYAFENVKVAKTGLFPWLVSELEQDGIRSALPDLGLAETVYLQRDSISKEAIDSIYLKPLSNDHPERGLVTPDNALEKGHGALGRGFMDGEWLVLDMVLVYTRQAKDALQSGKVELSIGYTYETPVEWVENLPYVAKEVIIYINHVAIVARGRAGPECRFNKREIKMDDEKIDKLFNSIEQIKGISSSLSLRLNALERMNSKSEVKNGVVPSSPSEEGAKQEEGKRGCDSKAGEEEGERPAGNGSGSEGKPEGGEGSGEEDSSSKESKRENTGEEVMKKELTIDAVEEYARSNDLFIVNMLDMQTLLKQVNTNGLIGLKSGKEFTSKDKTRINMKPFNELIDSELAVRKVEEEANKLTGRNNDAPSEVSMCDVIGI